MVVSFEPGERLLKLSRGMQLPFPVVSDPERVAYRAYQLKSAKISQLFAPGSMFAYTKLLAKGRWANYEKSDVRQLGGDFVIDREGIVRYEHRSASPADRPPVDGLDGLIETLGRV